ncbi:hypothetical protein O181_097474 [Austropuccinia psidii MF-1]|uniref:Uncharacterized protein n=1 Tax=Austropuccinia psidii MF-1 TaxID=1389203 RepID=A0A9Q3J8Z9_9BASI|nr:hypothetical protein [Austropuccinia psidii MF-1]
MGDAIREQSDDYQDTRKNSWWNTKRKPHWNPRHTVGSRHATRSCQQKLVQTHTRCTKIPCYTNQRDGIQTVFIANSQHLLIIDIGEQCSIMARNYLENHSQNWEKQLLQTKAKNFKGLSGKITSIGKIIKEIIIPHRKGKIRLNPEFCGA